MKKLAIGVANHTDKIDSDFFWNFNALVKPKGWEISLFRGTSRHKVSSLNEVTESALNWGADKIMYMDYDIIFPQDCLLKLIKHEKDIVGGLYHLKTPPYAPVAGWTKEEKGCRLCVNQNKNIWKYDYARFPDGDEHGLVEVEWTGIGCLMINASLLDAEWQKKKFYDTWNQELGIRTYGHDTNFCFDMAKKGVKTYIDRTINCSHSGRIDVDESFITAFYNAGMNVEWIKQIKERHSTADYWDRTWLRDDIGRTHRTYPGEFKFYIDNIEEGSKVADVGCGIGYFMRQLKAIKNCDVYGYDFSPLAIDKLKQAGLNGEVQNLLKWTAPVEGQYDCVTMNHTLEHFTEEDHDKVINILKGLCKKGGKIFISVPFPQQGLVDGCLEHLFAFNKDSFTALINKHFKSSHVGRSGHSFSCVAINE